MKYLLIILALVTTGAQAEHSHPMFQDNHSYKTKLLWPEVYIPWGMVQLPDGRMLATERSGTLYLLSETKPSQKISGLPEVHPNRQGGLLDITLHPEFTKNGLIFFAYSSKQGGGYGSNTAIMRAKLNLDSFSLSQQQVLYKGEENAYSGSHYGGRITIADNYLYFSIGDRGDRDQNPQDLTLDGGKIYRLNLDGSIPKSNPFYQQKGAKKAIYSYGHRNPQGLITIETAQGTQVWSHEHGPKGGDEINLIEQGKNYGWPVISYGVNYSGFKFTDLTAKAGMEQPKLYWKPSIAPSGMAYITSDKYPNWQGKILLGSMKFHHAVLVEISGDKVVKQTKLLADIGGRVRNVYQAPDGFIYLGIDGKGIVRVEAF